MERIRIGVICPSDIAFRRFMPSLKKTEGFEYAGVAVATREEFSGATEEILSWEYQKARGFVESYGGRVFDGYANMIESAQVDAVYLPLPPALHFQWARKALEHGKHVLVEKPSTTCLKDTQELVTMAAAKGLALYENYMFVLHDQIQAVKDLLNGNELGEVRLIRISFGFPRRDARDFRYNKQLGGGALLDAGGYTMRLATELLGGDVELTAAQAGYLDGFEVDMYGSATVSNEKGMVAQLAFGMDNDYRCDLEVWGSRGTLTTGRILTAPDGFVPTYTLKKNQDVQTGSFPADDAFQKSICRFGHCVNDSLAREESYRNLIRQERLVEAFKQRCGMD